MITCSNSDSEKVKWNRTAMTVLSLGSRFFRKVEKNLFRFASVGARARPSSLIEPIVIRSKFRAEGLAPPFDPFSIETRQLLTFRHRFEGFIDRDRPVAGSKSTGRTEKKTKERGKKLRTFFKVGKGRNKNLWTWPPEMSQLNNREIKVCTDYLYRFLRDDRFFFFFQKNRLVPSLSTRINIYDTFYYHRNWPDGWLVRHRRCKIERAIIQWKNDTFCAAPS